MVLGLSRTAMYGVGVFGAGALAAYYMDQAFADLLKNKYVFAAFGGLAALAAYAILQRNILRSLPAANI